MFVINAESVSHALFEGVTLLLEKGVKADSRNGSVLVLPAPLCTVYHTPARRVLFSPVRNANPFFHFMEALWMLQGRNDVGWPAFFAKNIENYSDDGSTLHGAYGHRWVKHFGHDQLDMTIKELQRDKKSRRIVVSMWDPDVDPIRAAGGGKDVPCNTHAYFQVNPATNFLDMMVCNRSNDIIWGAYGANAVHFSILHEYVAAFSGFPMGKYHQVSMNSHVYLKNYPEDKLSEIAQDCLGTDKYKGGFMGQPLVANGTTKKQFDDELVAFMNKPAEPEVTLPIFVHTAAPMYESWLRWKNNDYDGAMRAASLILSIDWYKACSEWLTRAQEKKNAK